MRRRDFLTKSLAGVAGTWLTPKAWAEALPAAAGKFSASDIVTLGQTGLKTLRLACGTGTVGVNHHSNQSALGIQGLADLLMQGYDHGLRFFDTADSYGTHAHVAAALKKLPREKITVMSKSWARDAAGMRADIDRFRKELGTDYIDILMMHCLTDDDWTEKSRAPWTPSRKPRRRELSAPTAARAIPSGPFAPRPNRLGSRSCSRA